MSMNHSKAELLDAYKDLKKQVGDLKKERVKDEGIFKILRDSIADYPYHQRVTFESVVRGGLVEFLSECNDSFHAVLMSAELSKIKTFNRVLLKSEKFSDADVNNYIEWACYRFGENKPKTPMDIDPAVYQEMEKMKEEFLANDKTN